MLKHWISLARLPNPLPKLGLVALLVVFSACLPDNTAIWSSIVGLSISPSKTAVPINGTLTFNASGGQSPYTFSVLPVSGGTGTVTSSGTSTALFTSPSTPGFNTVRVTDASGATADATVAIRLLVTCAPTQVVFGGTATCSASGGTAPYNFTASAGSINATTGAFTAPSAPGPVTIQVTDSTSPTPYTGGTVLTVYPPLTIAPNMFTLAVNDPLNFGATGGVGPYTYSITTNYSGAQITGSAYTAGPVSGVTDTVTVTDSLNNTASASVTVNPALVVTSPFYTIASNDSVTLAATGGVPSYAYIVTGTAGGSMSGPTYTPAQPGTAQITVTDMLGNKTVVGLTVNPPLVLTPGMVTVDVNGNYTFTPQGGVPPYSFSLAGPGVLNPLSGTANYTAPPTADLPATVTVMDSISNASTATVAVRMFSAGYDHACAVVNGNALCWGSNLYGQLGNGTIAANSPPGAVQMPVAAGPVQAISAGFYFTCAMAGGAAYCWGDPSFGELGNGATTGSFLVPTPVLGVGGTGNLTGVTSIFAGGDSTCAIANGGVFCWGSNGNGQLGNKSLTDSATPVQVVGVGGTGMFTGASSIAVERNSTCANAGGSVYCWGYNFDGELGNGNTIDSSTPAQVLDSTGTAFLTGATSITAGNYHACANVGGTPYCWGNNLDGNLGNNSTVSSSIPVAVSGVGGTLTLTGVTALTAGYTHTCANAAGTTVCWGYNGSGEIGSSSLPPGMVALTPLSTGLAGVQTLGAGNTFSCGTVPGTGLYCWGDNSLGQYGSASLSSPTPVLSISMP